MSPRALVLVNPHARRLKRGRLAAEQVQAILGRRGDVILTKDLDDVRAVLSEALQDELACIVTVGGDGALHWAMHHARAIGKERGITLPPFLPARSGTIDFVARKVGLEGSPAEILQRLANSIEEGRELSRRSLPTLTMHFEDEAGVMHARDGFATAIAGVGARFFEQYYAFEDPSPASIVQIIARAIAGFPFGTANATRLFKQAEAEVHIDGLRLDTPVHSALHVGSIDLDLGGVLRVFPFAGAGKLHLQAGVLAPKAMIASLPAIMRGGGLHGEGLVDRAGDTLEARATGDELFRPILDGECLPACRRISIRLGAPVDVVVV
jgi:hypothetical protein